MLEEKAFEPSFLARLDRLVLAIKQVRAQRPGQRLVGRIQGVSLEIENFKPYSRGDDLRFLDWNVFGRLDELVVRTYRSERKVEVSILLDLSASMRFPAEDNKAGLALAIACSLAYIALGENDAVRLVGISRRKDSITLYASPFLHRRESYPELKEFIKNLRFDGPTGLTLGVAEVLNQRRPRGKAILVSDFLVPFDDSRAAISRLTAAGYEVAVVHVLGESECQGILPNGAFRVYDSETGEMREIYFDGGIAELYRRRLRSLIEELRNFCNQNEITYVQAFGANNLEDILIREAPRLRLVY